MTLSVSNLTLKDRHIIDESYKHLLLDNKGQKFYLLTNVKSTIREFIHDQLRIGKYLRYINKSVKALRFS